MISVRPAKGYSLTVEARHLPERPALAVDAVWPHVEAMGPLNSDARPTTFEVLTAMAFHLFKEEAVDVQVVEARRKLGTPAPG